MATVVGTRRPAIPPALDHPAAPAPAARPTDPPPNCAEPAVGRRDGRTAEMAVVAGTWPRSPRRICPFPAYVRQLRASSPSDRPSPHFPRLRPRTGPTRGQIDREAQYSIGARSGARVAPVRRSLKRLRRRARTLATHESDNLQKLANVSLRGERCTAPGSLDTHLCYAAWRNSYSSRASIGV